MGSKKLVELDAIISRPQQMKALSEHGLRCDCLTLDEWVVVMAQNYDIMDKVDRDYS